MSNEKVIRITPKQPLFSINLSELLEFKELWKALLRRDIKIRYKQTLMGGVWAIIQPFFTMVIFSFFFGKIAQIPSDGIPYPIFSYSGLLIWTLFSNGLTIASNSLVVNSRLIDKVYFPRLVIPYASTLVTVIDYLIALLVIFFLLLFYKIPLSPLLLALPAVVLGVFVFTTGIGLWLATLNVKFRDVRFVLPFFIQLIIYITPIIYPYSVAGNFKWLVALNPLTAYVELHRDIILGNTFTLWPELCYSIIASIGITLTGLLYFKHHESKFSDII